MRMGRGLRAISLAVVLAATAMAGGGRRDPRPPVAPDTPTAELWRRGRCILSSVVVPAQRAAKVPRELRGARATEGRPFSGKVKIAAWTRDARFLWAATDTEVLQIDLATRRLVRSYGKADGLPDWPVDELLSDGGTLWIAHREGLAALSIGETKIEDRPDATFRFARLHRDEAGVWAIADNATLRFAGDAAPKRLPALPTGSRMASTLKTGVWLARRRQQTAYFVSDALSLGGRLVLASFGGIYELADGAWRQVAREGWSPRAGHGAVWFLTTKGAVRYDPKTQESRLHGMPKPLPVGRPTHLAVTEKAVWVAIEPREDPQAKAFVGGGIARLDVASGEWTVWQTINERRADHVTALEARDGAVWASAIGYQEYRTLSAHPGMMHCTRTVPVLTGLCLHRYTAADARWTTLHLETPECEARRILGQWEKHSMGVMVPRIVDATAAGEQALFGIVRMFPKTFYSGYYTSVDRLAVRKGDSWEVSYGHHPEQLGLHGEQPSVLLISESHGKRIVYGDGHDHVLGLFTHGGRAWTVTEGCIAWADAATGKWTPVAETGFRFYWKATAALDDSHHLWIGSDRGIVARLDLATNRFEMLTRLTDRQITRITYTTRTVERKTEGGVLREDIADKVVAMGRAAERGCLPAQLEGRLPGLDCDAAARGAGVQGDQTWKPARPLPPVDVFEGWSCDGKSNFLNRIDPRTSQSLPAYYLVGVFQPRVLCVSPDGRRIWLATYSGIVRVDHDREKGAK